MTSEIGFEIFEYDVEGISCIGYNNVTLRSVEAWDEHSKSLSTNARVTDMIFKYNENLAFIDVAYKGSTRKIIRILNKIQEIIVCYKRAVFHSPRPLDFLTNGGAQIHDDNNDIMITENRIIDLSAKFDNILRFDSNQEHDIDDICVLIKDFESIWRNKQ